MHLLYLLHLLFLFSYQLRSLESLLLRVKLLVVYSSFRQFVLLHLTLEYIFVAAFNLRFRLLLLFQKLLSQHTPSLVPTRFFVGLLLATNLVRASNIVHVFVVNELLSFYGLLLDILKPLLVRKKWIIVQIVIKLFQSGRALRRSAVNILHT